QEDDDLFPDGLIRCPPQMLRELPPGFEDNYDFLISSIVNLVEYLGVRFVIIDNLTWLSPNLESSRAAQRLMQTLANLKNGLGVSILVLAHTPKRFSRSPILIAHLHGSKMLSNFAESMFAMGTSRRGNRIRYIKAIKYRYSPDRDTETEVATVRIGKEGSFLGFTFENFTDERSHVGWRHRETSAARPEFVRKVEELVLRQFTQREIADELGVSQTTINRCLKGKNEEGSPVSL
ncbi:MAG TPA: hypothetical protein VK612_09665, partial [Pyrinomonadaceae bacterium]|nr:hypothetical protein [Pyrinomonadaceae bacterium]